jgi:hypothetical protein
VEVSVPKPRAFCNWFNLMMHGVWARNTLQARSAPVWLVGWAGDISAVFISSLYSSLRVLANSTYVTAILQFQTRFLIPTYIVSCLLQRYVADVLRARSLQLPLHEQA